MDRTPLVHIFAAVASAFLVTLLMAPTASAAAAPPGALFHSDFSDYDADWRSLPHVNAPSVTQLDDAAEVGVSPGSFGRFSSRTTVSGLTTLDDLDIVLEVNEFTANRLDVLLAFFNSGGGWIGSTVVDRATGAVADTTVTIPLTGTSTPEGWVDFQFLFIVRGGPSAINSVQFDEVALVPSGFGAVVPEPSTALLLGLGLIRLGANQRRRS